MTRAKEARKDEIMVHGLWVNALCFMEAFADDDDLGC